MLTVDDYAKVNELPDTGEARWRDGAVFKD